MTNFDNYMQYMAGWRCGAGIKTVDEKRANHKDQAFADLYNEGWSDGRKAGQQACMKASRRFKYNPSIIK